MNYQLLYNSMIVNPGRETQAKKLADRIKLNQAKYQLVSDMVGCPWYVVAVIHYRESSLSFNGHLHNGDSLKHRTVRVPAGRPKGGMPPFTWHESAIDALVMKKFHQVTDWSIENILDLLERYNGLGYKRKGLPSPYIWSWSSVYSKGKYVADGKYDPDFVDGQCGCAVLLKYLM